MWLLPFFWFGILFADATIKNGINLDMICFVWVPFFLLLGWKLRETAVSVYRRHR